MEKVYKIVYRNENDSLVSFLAIGYYQRVYAQGDDIYTVDSALCFDTEQNARLFYDCSEGGFYELWEAESETKEYVGWLVLVSILNKYKNGFFDDLTSINKDSIDSDTIIESAPGTIFCKNVRLKERIL